MAYRTTSRPSNRNSKATNSSVTTHPRTEAKAILAGRHHHPHVSAYSRSRRNRPLQHARRFCVAFGISPP
ncbi:hypothetical protein BDW60DRAFT_177722 [Aspergillus nidulans var. acristatus]